jgi:hypothetical protein
MHMSSEYSAIDNEGQPESKFLINASRSITNMPSIFALLKILILSILLQIMLYIFIFNKPYNQGTDLSAESSLNDT